ncbi:hypothetical protein [Phaeovulum sp. W22_SRMD_FR3]|uniref:hypothetical protein n=1 Tax=Phaeovulum sp. W22_SRMD_FR3 TaxID=3240274 RepID=UPI003F9858B9
MPLDHISEIIAHFIGTLHTTGETLRMREEYEGFRGRHPAADPAFDPTHVRIHITSPYDLEGFDPGLRLELPPSPPGQPGGIRVELAATPHHTISLLHLSGMSTGARILGASGQKADVTWKIPLPPEVITVTEQVLYLSDNDLLSFRGGTSFADPAGLTEFMHDLAAQAAALGGDLSNLIYGLLPDADVPTAADILSFAESVTALPAEAGQMPLIRLYSPTASDEGAADTAGTDASGTDADEVTLVYVNGHATDSMPDFHDYLPAAVAARIDPPADQTPAAGDTAAPGAGYADAYAVPAGHHLTTGGNLTVNEAYIASNGVDADVILVGGNLVQIDAISQVNLAYTTAGTALGAAADSTMPEARPPAAADLTGAAETGDASHGADITGVTAPVAAPPPAAHPTPETDPAPGAARAINAAHIDPHQSLPDPAAQTGSAHEMVLPAHWQLQRIEGDVVFENRIDQHIFASDHDRVEAVFTASATAISTGDNTLSNFTTLQALSQHYDFVIVGGNFLTLNLIQQVNVLFDVDDVSGVPGDGVWSWGNDLLMNSADILHGSRDTLHEIQDSFQQQLQSLAEGGAALSATVARDALFDGHAMLSALYISGDLIESNIIRQFSYLGDVDQIALAQGEALATASAAGMSIDTGQNVMLNAARINDLGIDSALVAAGQVYSDALIHQAGLIDAQMPGLDGLTGPSAALVSEAVAFLVPEMMEQGQSDLPQALAHPGDLAGAAAPPDGLHMLMS